MTTTPTSPVDSSNVTQGGGIPDDALDALVAATIPDADDSTENLSGVGATMPAMTNTLTNAVLPSPPLPAGTTWNGEWFEGARDCYSRARIIAASGWLRHDVKVFIHVIQRANGEIEERVIVPPDLHPDRSLSSAQARQIGEALISVADEFDALGAEAVAK